MDRISSPTRDQLHDDPAVRPETHGRWNRRRSLTALVAAGAVVCGTLAACSSPNGSSAHFPTHASTSQGPHGGEDMLAEITNGNDPMKNQDPQLPYLKGALADGIDPHQMMNFIGFPTNAAAAESLATSTAEQIKLWNECGVSQAIVMDPSGQNVKEIRSNPEYHQALDAFLATLHDSLAGADITHPPQFIIMSEGNILPNEIDATGPKQFVGIVSQTADAIKKYFPGEQSSTAVLLNFETYRNDHNWNNHTTNPRRLTAYVVGLQGKIDEVYLEGFPFAPDDSGPNNGNNFASAKLAMDLARAADVTKIGVDTGLWGEEYSVNDNTQLFTAKMALRQTWARQVGHQLKIMKDHGFEVTLNIFDQNNIQHDNGSTGRFQLSNSLLRYVVQHVDGTPVTIYNTSQKAS